MKRVLTAVTLLAGLCLAAPAPASPSELEQIRKEIARQGLGWEAGETNVSRLPPEQRARLRMPKGQIPPWWKWDHPGENHRPRPLDRQGRSNLPNPASLDWRNMKGNNFLTTPRDQGSCGSCWAFSIIGTLEGTIAIRKSMTNPTLDLSEQNLADCATASTGCDSGGITWDVGLGVGGEGYITGTGVTTEQCYPYTSGTTGSLGTCTAPTGACATLTKAEDYYNLTDSTPGYPWEWFDPPEFVPDQAVVDEIKTLLQERPVGTSMRAYDDLSYYTKGVYEPANLTQGSGLHAVVIVGYDDAGGYWIVRNSWDPTWGEGGYFKIKYGTSSLGMFSYTLQYDEANKAPAFCPDLPTTLTLTGSLPVPLKIANCGSGILDWTAQLRQGWIQIKDATGNVVTSGNEVAKGANYTVSASPSQPAGSTGSIVLNCYSASNTPATINITTLADPPDAAAPGPDAAPPGPDAAPPGPDAETIVGRDAGTILDPDDAGTGVKKDGGSAAVADGSTDGDGDGGGGCGCGAGAASAPSALGALLVALLGLGRRVSRRY